MMTCQTRLGNHARLYGHIDMTTNNLPGLLYEGEETVDPFALAKGLMTAQAPKNKAYWDYRLKMNDFETPDEELFRRANEQRNPQPQGQRPQGQVGQTSISDVQFQAYVNRLQAPPYNMPPDRARAAAMEQLKLQGLMR